MFIFCIIFKHKPSYFPLKHAIVAGKLTRCDMAVIDILVKIATNELQP